MGGAPRRGSSRSRRSTPRSAPACPPRSSGTPPPARRAKTSLQYSSRREPNAGSTRYEAFVPPTRAGRLWLSAANHGSGRDGPQVPGRNALDVPADIWALWADFFLLPPPRTNAADPRGARPATDGWRGLLLLAGRRRRRGRRRGRRGRRRCGGRRRRSRRRVRRLDPGITTAARDADRRHRRENHQTDHLFHIVTSTDRLLDPPCSVRQAKARFRMDASARRLPSAQVFAATPAQPRDCGDVRGARLHWPMRRSPRVTRYGYCDACAVRQLNWGRNRPVVTVRS
jgi:hypothetical protein